MATAHQKNGLVIQVQYVSVVFFYVFFLQLKVKQSPLKVPDNSAIRWKVQNLRRLSLVSNEACHIGMSHEEFVCICFILFHHIMLHPIYFHSLSMAPDFARPCRTSSCFRRIWFTRSWRWKDWQKNIKQRYDHVTRMTILGGLHELQQQKNKNHIVLMWKDPLWFAYVCL